MPTATDTVKCLRCGNIREIKPCPNCGHTNFKLDGLTYDSRLLECTRCTQYWRIWTCQCGTENPFAKTMNSKCFIATAAYGSPSAKSVIVLREFRDVHLRKTIYGQNFIRMYEKYSPPIAALIAQKNFLRFIVRKTIVTPAAWLVEKLYVRER